ncbi:alpha-glucan family phosphorylase [Paraflavisolibacter sp. H34]|uniref:alpha-glucan family phosphorylase n=1 Tax=Huijunlia imazamoxiresistens TaxID=3127457 RepID=UPI003015C6BF
METSWKAHEEAARRPKDPDALRLLTELAHDLQWSWNHGSDKIWRDLDPVLWELTHNPAVVLQTVSLARLEEVLDDPAARSHLEELAAEKRRHQSAPAWFQQAYPQSPLGHVVFFSMEFMLSEALPIYSGGLGNVAGDHLKAASDLGLPLTGVGLLYQRGYSRQIIEPGGDQVTVYPYNAPSTLPIQPLRTAEGEWLRIEVKLPGYSLWLRCWQVQVGRVRLLLLDTNDPANIPVHRGITGELYGGGTEIRLLQELVLGIGGWRLLKALGIKPDVCHLNEGHAAFAVLERAQDYRKEANIPFSEALAITRAGNLFTTHTAVAAGFDHFPPALIERYLTRFARRLGLTMPDFLALGRLNPDDTNEPFTTAFLAIRGSGLVNGVSRLHGEVSRQLFGPLFPRWPLAEVPVGYITNGIHTPGWDSPEVDALWTEACGKDRWQGTLEAMHPGISAISDERLWQMRCDTEEGFIEYIRRRYARQLAALGIRDAANQTLELFDPRALTLGFARRFVPYKRPNLLLRQPERLHRILTNPDRPVQLILAGKAHPADTSGQALIREWVQYINRYQLGRHVIFLSDYDMQLTEHLVQGVDVWINTPRRPWEACGTSGMKVLVNGGLNLSVLDGWWAEAYTPEVGWALGDGTVGTDEGATDDREAAQLYDLLEHQIIPEFYQRDDRGIPLAWVARMRASMSQLTPRFSANRSAREYTEACYLPAAAAYHQRSDSWNTTGKQQWEALQTLIDKWPQVRFGQLEVTTTEEKHQYTVEVHLGDIDPGEVAVELYADGTEAQQMSVATAAAGDGAFYRYTAIVPASRPAGDYTPRIRAQSGLFSVPLECGLILWQR